MASDISQVKPSKVGAEKPRLRAIISIIALISLFWVAALFPISGLVKADQLGDAVYAGAFGAASGAVIGSALGGPVGAGVGAVVGAIWGSIAGYLSHSNGDAALSGAKLAYAHQLSAPLFNLFNMSDAAADQYQDDMDAMLNYFIRNGEYAAAELYTYQETNHLPHIFDTDYILSKSRVADELLLRVIGTLGFYNAALWVDDQISSTFVGTYNDMAWGIPLYSGSKDYASTSGDMMIMRYTNRIMTGTNQYVLLNGNDLPGEYNKMFVADPWQHADTLIHINITSPSGIVAYSGDFPLKVDQIASVNLSINAPGVNLISGSRYHINAHDSAGKNVAVYYAGACPAPSHGGTVTPTLLLRKYDSTSLAMYWAGSIAYTSGSGTEVYYAGTDGSNLSFGAGNGIYFGSSSSAFPASPLIDLTGYAGAGGHVHIFNPLVRMITAQTSAASASATVVAFSQAAYQVMVIGGQVPAAFVPPSAALPDPSQYGNRSWQEIYLIWKAYNAASMSWFANYSLLDDTMINISAQSLNLTIKGSINSSTGQSLFGPSTIFTPMAYLHNATLYNKVNNTLLYPMMVITWGNTTGNLSLLLDGNWFEDNITYGKVGYALLPAGTKILPSVIMFEGNAVDKVDLNVTSLHLILPDLSDQTGPPPQSPGDAQWLIEHWYYFGMIAGGIMTLLALPYKSMILVMIGLAVLLISLGGWYFSDTTWWNNFLVIRSQVSAWWWFG